MAIGLRAVVELGKIEAHVTTATKLEPSTNRTICSEPEDSSSRAVFLCPSQQESAIVRVGVSVGRVYFKSNLEIENGFETSKY
jgi:hypothetical protein